jgi:CxxC motif-containing protein (DUF1111 family)
VSRQHPARPELLLQIIRDFGELGKGGFQVLDNFLCDHVGIGKVGAVFEAFVLSQSRATDKRARQTGRAEKPTQLGNEEVKMSRFRWKARPRLWLRYGSHLVGSS